MKEINTYQPETNSICEGQVLSCPYDCEKTRLIVREMTDSLIYQLMDKGLVTDGLTLDIGYDRENCDKGGYRGPVHIDRYGRTLPKPAHGSVRLESATNLGSQLQAAAAALFDRIADPKLTVRRLTLTANRVVRDEGIFQTDFFTDAASLEKEKSLQEAMLGLKKRFGKNAVLKGSNYLEGRHYAGPQRADRRPQGRVRGTAMDDYKKHPRRPHCQPEIRRYSASGTPRAFGKTSPYERGKPRPKFSAPLRPCVALTTSWPKKAHRPLRVPKAELSEEEKSTLSARLAGLCRGMTVTVRYFVPDLLCQTDPPAGRYRTVTGVVQAPGPDSENFAPCAGRPAQRPGAGERKSCDDPFCGDRNAAGGAGSNKLHLYGGKANAAGHGMCHCVCPFCAGHIMDTVQSTHKIYYVLSAGNTEKGGVSAAV